MVHRQHKVDLYLLIAVLALGFQTGAIGTLDSLRQFYEEHAGHTLARSSFSSRMNKVMATLLQRLVRRAVPQERHLPPLRWAALFARQARRLLSLLANPEGPDAKAHFESLVHEVPDPNRRRESKNLEPVPAFLTP